jgi:hypothetical protein
MSRLLQTGLVDSVAKTLGRGQSKTAIISSLCLATIILLSSLYIGSYFHPDVFRFADRTTYHQYFENRYFFSLLIDSIIISLSGLVWTIISFNNRFKWPTSLLIIGLFVIGISTFNSSSILQIISVCILPFIIAVYLINKRMQPKILHQDSSLITINYFSVFFFIIALISIYLSILGSSINNPFMDMITLLSRFAPAVMLLLIFSLFLRIIVKGTILSIPKIKTKFFQFVNSFSVPEYSIGRKSSRILLSILMALAVVIVLIPHFDNLQNAVGEDTFVYTNWIEEMRGSVDARELLELAFVEIQFGDRPLSLLIMYGISLVLDTLLAFEILLPSLLAPLLVFSIYLLTKEITGNALAALFSSFITAVSFQVMIGVYAGFYANLIALVFGYISILFAIRFLKGTNGNKNLLWFSISLVGVLLSHVYTWTIITAFLVIFSIVLRQKNIYESERFKIIFIVIGCIIAFDFAKSFLLDSSSAALRDLVVAESLDFGLLQFATSWSTLVRTVEVFLGGIFGNIIVLLLALYCGLLFRQRNLAEYFIIVFLSLGIIPIFFGDKIVQSRIFYDIPLQIPAGVALTSIFVGKDGKLKSIAIIAGLIAISVYTMTNLGVSPR